MYYEIACIRYVSKRELYRYYVHVCEQAILWTLSTMFAYLQARSARSAGNSAIKNSCIIIINIKNILLARACLLPVEGRRHRQGRREGGGGGREEEGRGGHRTERQHKRRCPPIDSRCDQEPLDTVAVTEVRLRPHVLFTVDTGICPSSSGRQAGRQAGRQWWSGIRTQPAGINKHCLFYFYVSITLLFIYSRIVSLCVSLSCVRTCVYLCECVRARARVCVCVCGGGIGGQGGRGGGGERPVTEAAEAPPVYT